MNVIRINDRHQAVEVELNAAEQHQSQVFDDCLDQGMDIWTAVRATIAMTGNMDPEMIAWLADCGTWLDCGEVGTPDQYQLAAVKLDVVSTL